jgi:hypothetical protein
MELTIKKRLSSLPNRSPYFLGDLCEWISRNDNFKDRLEYHRENRSPNSGQWFLNEFDSWLQGTSKGLVGWGPRTKSNIGQS